MRPLDRFGSIKLKLGAVIVATIGMTVAVVTIGVNLGAPLWVLAGIAAVASLGLVHFLARGMTSPLREMADAADEMSRGNYDRRVPASSRDEVGDLARSFNRMATDLAAVDRTRKDLIANVSHELRTPISALQAVLENVIDGVQPADPETMTTMLGQVERLGKLVSQLLDLSRLESGAETLHKEDVQVSALLDQNAREIELTGRSVQIDVDVEPSGLLVQADPVKLHHVLSNLLGNAVRHSPEGGRITVSARKNGVVTIEVIDEGPGIPEEKRQRVFERFYSSDAEGRGMDGGSGLGLSIARWIVELHGGNIETDTAGEGGCRMLVTLPEEVG